MDTDADTNSLLTPSTAPSSVSHTAPVPTVKSHDVPCHRANVVPLVAAGSVGSSLPSESLGEQQVPKVYSASSLASGVPVVKANSVSNVPVVEAGSVSTRSRQKGHFQLATSASILHCEGPSPTAIEY